MKFFALILFITFAAEISFSQEIDLSSDASAITIDQSNNLEIDLTPAQFSENSIKTNKNNEKIKYFIPEPDVVKMESYGINKLSSDDYQSFLKTRKDFLFQAARILQSLKFGFGMGSIIKNKFQFRAEKKQTEELIAYANTLEPSMRDDLLLSIQRSQQDLNDRVEESKKKSFREKANQVILNILISIDHQLWQQAGIVAHANEFGVMVAAGIEAEGGTRNKGGWGGLTDLGISLGFNRDDKSIAIQIFHGYEPYHSTQMPMVFIAGLVTKAGLYIANQKEELTAKGSSFYPPMAPAFSSSTNRSFMAGFSSGLTWPPSPLGDMLTYSNKLKQTTLLRLTVSPLTKGFIRIQSGALNQILSASYLPIKNLFFGAAKIQCSALF